MRSTANVVRSLPSSPRRRSASGCIIVSEIGAQVAGVGQVVVDLRAAADGVDDELRLARVAPVDRGLADAGAGGDAFDADAGVAVLGEQRRASLAGSPRRTPGRAAARARRASGVAGRHPAARHRHRFEVDAVGHVSTSSRARAGRKSSDADGCEQRDARGDEPDDVEAATRSSRSPRSTICAEPCASGMPPCRRCPTRLADVVLDPVEADRAAPPS